MLTVFVDATHTWSFNDIQCLVMKFKQGVFWGKNARFVLLMILLRNREMLNVNIAAY